MNTETVHNRILILGASGFIGNALYKDLHPYFDVYGTYCHQHQAYKDNQVFHSFCVEENSIGDLLKNLKPRFIIVALTGTYSDRLKLLRDLCLYAEQFPESRIVYFSSSEIFDGQRHFPGYEYDKPVPESTAGRFHTAAEKYLQEQLPFQTALLRLPLVLGVNSPTLVQLRQSMKHHASFEIFPKHIVSATTQDKLAQQTHYIINQKLTGIFHLSSSDVIHHDDLFTEIASKIGFKMPIFKKVYSSNDDLYRAILPRDNKLPGSLQFSISEVIDACTLKEEIITFKN
ncbi:sugar nucleotide-binding protein [Marixanthomonas spongiae]|uniref:dTDP-4-dehydrorhamnose reductase n=1 Tax=Marixanthomonas spongiae TaxID=2174845 RepID=A0A2U0HWF2_9FLAO|nr:sugar nucleotide-binding protein [Marixanthomonas spongiae]PVW13185.1 dTDP-4-dehydrorhamnose reductase [Marixanthomonas spongiae]